MTATVDCAALAAYIYKKINIDQLIKNGSSK